MSTGAECVFTEVLPGRWVYWLQDYPYGETSDGALYPSGRSHDSYDPLPSPIGVTFPSFHAAHEHLSNNHANPGGWSMKHLSEAEGHVHEWHQTQSQRPGGVSLRFDITATDDPAKALELIRSGTLRPDASWPLRVWKDVTECESCGKDKPA